MCVCVCVGGVYGCDEMCTAVGLCKCPRRGAINNLLLVRHDNAG